MFKNISHILESRRVRGAICFGALDTATGILRNGSEQRILAYGLAFAQTPSEFYALVRFDESQIQLQLWHKSTLPEIAARQIAALAFDSDFGFETSDSRQKIGIGLVQIGIQFQLAVHSQAATAVVAWNSQQGAAEKGQLRNHLGNEEDEERLLRAIEAVLRRDRSQLNQLPACDSTRVEFADQVELNRCDFGFMDEPAEGTGVEQRLQRRAQLGDDFHLISGSFQPLHRGHLEMAEYLERYRGGNAAFELSINNADKPRLDHIELRKRSTQEFGKRPLFVTRSANFVDKAQLFPGTKFAVGADTIVRVAMPKYYQGGASEMISAIKEIRHRGCGFVVFGRILGQKFATLNQLELPTELVEICEMIDENEFRCDLSSTFLRKQRIETDDSK